MEVYAIGLIISVFFSIFTKSNFDGEKHKISNKFFIILSAIPLIIISGFRYFVGADYGMYALYFMKINNKALVKNLECGYVWLNKIIRIYTDDFMWLFIITSIIFIFFVYKAIYEQSPQPTISIFLLVACQYYFAALNGLRQMIAVAIFLYSIKYIKERRFIPYCIFNMIGASFHLSALAFIPVYFLYNLKLDQKKQGIVLLVVTIFSATIGAIIRKFVMNSSYAEYLGGKFDTGKVGYVAISIALFIWIFGIALYKKGSKSKVSQKDYSFYLSMMWINCILKILDGTVPLIRRFSWGFGIVSIIFIPIVLGRIEDKKSRMIATIAIVLLYSMYIIYNLLIVNTNMVLPYRWIFER